MAITYSLSGSTNVITVTGGSQAAPITWDDIVAADAAGAWGLIDNIGTYITNTWQVAQPTIIRIGDGTTSTYVLVQGEFIVFKEGYFQAYSNATLVLGANSSYASSEAISASQHSFQTVVHMTGIGADPNIRFVSGLPTIVMQGCYLYGQPNVLAFNGTIKMRSSMARYLWGGGVLELIDSNLHSYSSFTSTGPTYTVGRCWVGSFESYGIPVTIRNSTIHAFLGRVNTQFTCINVKYVALVLSDFFHVEGTSAWAKFYHTLDLTVQDANANVLAGAAVEIANDVLGVVYSGVTDANGQIPQQELLYFYRLVNMGTPTETIDTTYTPYTVTISKAGYLDRTSVLAMDEETVQVETLQEPTYLTDALAATITEDSISAVITDDVLVAVVED